MSKRARAIASATAVSLTGFAFSGFGGLRPASAYGAGLAPRSFSVACDVTVSDDTGLQAQVVASADDSVICIDQSITLSGPLEIDDTTVTLAGRDDSIVTLTAPGGGRHIEATSAASDDTLTIDHLTIFDGRSVKGGAIFARGIDIVTVSSVFDYNQSSGEGGAIYAFNDSTLTATNTDFTNNTADDSGVVWVDDTVTTIGGTFSSNRSSNGGGGAIYALAVRTTNTDFSSNYAKEGGGAISSGYATVTGGSFTGNKAKNRGGGAIYAEDGPVTTTNATFAQNYTITSSGGAIYAKSGVVSTTDDTFTYNFAPTGFFGGAIWADDTVIATGAAFNINFADLGGAIFTNAAAFVTAAAFRGNFAAALSGGAIAAIGDVTATDVTFWYNRALATGGGIYSSNGVVAVTNSTFYANAAVTSGAAVRARSGGVDLAFVTSLDDSSAAGSVLSSGGSVTVVGSVITPAAGGGAACNTAADDSSIDAFVSDSSCGAGDDTVTVTTRGLLGFDDTLVTDDSTGMQVLIPDDTSILIGAAPFNLVPGVLVDQLGAVRGARGSATTTVGAVQVLPVLFTTQPAGATAPAGSSASFTVAADPGVGTSPVTFQWQTSTDNGATWSTLSGATGSTLTLPNLSTAQNGLLVRAVASDLRPAAATSATALLTVTAAPSPLPPGPPRDPEATAADAAAEVTWTAPTSTGSFPITTYQVTNDIDDRTCLLTVGPDTPLTCDVTGLTNNTTYRFRVRALTGAGWGPWSEWTTPVTPRKPSIVITGTRDGQRVRAAGTTTGIEATQAKTRVRLQGQKKYQTGVPRQITPDGTFTWQRKTSKKVYVYFTADSIRSNRIIIRAQG